MNPEEVNYDELYKIWLETGMNCDGETCYAFHLSGTVMNGLIQERINFNLYGYDSCPPETAKVLRLAADAAYRAFFDVIINNNHNEQKDGKEQE